MEEKKYPYIGQYSYGSEEFKVEFTAPNTGKVIEVTKGNFYNVGYLCASWGEMWFTSVVRTYPYVGLYKKDGSEFKVYFTAERTGEVIEVTTSWAWKEGDINYAWIEGYFTPIPNYKYPYVGHYVTSITDIKVRFTKPKTGKVIEVNESSNSSLHRIGVYSSTWSEDLFKPVTTTKGEEVKKAEKFIIGSIHKTTKKFSIKEYPHEHTDKGLAETEAARLAKEFTEKKFVVLQIVGICSMSDVCWE